MCRFVKFLANVVQNRVKKWLKPTVSIFLIFFVKTSSTPLYTQDNIFKWDKLSIFNSSVNWCLKIFLNVLFPMYMLLFSGSWAKAIFKSINKLFLFHAVAYCNLLFYLLIFPFVNSINENSEEEKDSFSSNQQEHF